MILYDGLENARNVKAGILLLKKLLNHHHANLQYQNQKVPTILLMKFPRMKMKE